MAKKKAGEIDTEEKTDVVEKTEKVSAPSSEQLQLQQALAQANELIAKLEKANKQIETAGEKKDNTKPIPLSKESFLKYVAFLKDKKPRIYQKKLDELQIKATKFGVSI